MWCGVVGLVLRFLLFPFRDDFQRSVSQQTSFVTAECTISAVAVRYLILPAQSCACISTAWSSPEIDRTNERTGTYLGCWSWENVKTQLSIPPIPTLPRVIFDSGPHTTPHEINRHDTQARRPYHWTPGCWGYRTPSCCPSRTSKAGAGGSCGWRRFGSMRPSRRRRSASSTTRSVLARFLPIHGMITQADLKRRILQYRYGLTLRNPPKASRRSLLALNGRSPPPKLPRVHGSFSIPGKFCTLSSCGFPIHS